MSDQQRQRLREMMRRVSTNPPQELAGPEVEADLRTKDPTTGPAQVAAMLRRSLSWMFGWDGSNWRKVRVNRVGQLITAPYGLDYAQATEHTKTNAVTGSEVDIGFQPDVVFLTGADVWLDVELRQSSGVSGPRVLATNVTVSFNTGVQHYSSAMILHTRARYLYLRDTSGTAGDVDIAALRF